MRSKEWLNRLKVINNYLPRMKKGQQKYTNQELVEKIIVNAIPEAWEREFKILNGPRAKTMQEVQTILQK